jgi:hypothetical protein
MSEKQEPESVEENLPNDTAEADRKALPDKTPSRTYPAISAEEERKRKSEPAPHRKPGPSIDIGPGPGSDVIATPPKRI